jgi:hypothetical protein
MDFSNIKFSFKRPVTSYDKLQKLISAVLRNRAFHVNWKAIESK